MNIDELEVKVNITNLEKMLCLLKEIKVLAAEMFDEKSEDYLFMKANLGQDTWNKVGAILRTLEIGSPSIAHSKMVLHVCEDMLEKCSLTLGAKMDRTISGEQEHDVLLNGEQISRFLAEIRQKA